MNDHIYLAHHGIKGMKWGVRRFRNEDGTLTEAGVDRYYKKAHKTDRRLKAAKEKGASPQKIAKLQKKNEDAYLNANYKHIQSEVAKDLMSRQKEEKHVDKLNSAEKTAAKIVASRLTAERLVDIYGYEKVDSYLSGELAKTRTMFVLSMVGALAVGTAITLRME